MTTRFVLTIAITGIILAACGGKKDKQETADSKTPSTVTTANGVNPQIETELKKVLQLVKSGFVPGTTEISKINDFDKEATPFEMNGKATGNYHSIIDNDEVNIEKFYSTNYTRPGILYEIRFNPSDKTLEKDGDITNLDMNAYVPIIDETLGVKGAKGTTKGFEEYMVWQTDKVSVWGNASLNSFLLYIRKELH